MEKFIVSARKYRPQTFDTVVGQSAITTTLKTPSKIINWRMLFYFADHVALEKQPVHEFLPKQLIVKIAGPMERLVTNVIPVFRLMKALH